MVGSGMVGAKEISGLLRIPLGSLYNLVNEGRIPHIHVGRALRFDQPEVMTWFKQGGDTVQGRFACRTCQGRKGGLTQPVG